MADITRRSFVRTTTIASFLALAGCASGQTDAAGSDAGSDGSDAAVTATAATATSDDFAALAIDQAAWSYDADNDVYYQIGVPYCTAPVADAFESMGIYVPGAYFVGTVNSDGETYTCEVAASGTKGDYTAATAPWVMPVNTAGYSAQEAPTSYSYDGLGDYLEAGLIYLYAGCRGRDNGQNDDGSSFDGGAPWGVTDLKAAVRCIRYNADLLPGDTSQVFTFGHSGGGAQSALMGATGDSELYLPYLESIGAVTVEGVSDAIAGAMCWCPITSLDVADEAYEWMMGQFADSGTRADGTWTKLLSDDLAQEFATYVNGMGLVADGEALALDEGGEGLWTSGSYYDYLLDVVEGSLNNFLTDTEFPYTPSSSSMADGGFAGGGAPSGDGGAPSGEAPSGDSAPDGEMPGDGEMPRGEAPSGDGAPDGEMPGNGDSQAVAAAGDASDTTESTTYEDAQAYIDALNADEEWIAYDADSNMATITSLGAFVRACKSASKDVGAFDDLNRGQAENSLFGNGETDALHFDATMAQLLQDNAADYAECDDYDSGYADEYAADMGNTDALGVETPVRQDMYNPLYYLCEAFDGCGTADVAPQWRIRTGIEQGDTSLTTEVNLALALEAYAGVKGVDFQTVWGQGHTTAERTGSSTTNFIEWVASCM